MKPATKQPCWWTLGIVVTTVLLAGCVTPSSTVSGAWQSPKTRTEPYHSVLVVAAAPRDDARRAFEITLANAIVSGGNAKATTTFGSVRTSDLSKDAVVRLAERAQADAVLVTRILNQSWKDGKTAEEVITHRGRAVSVSHIEDTNMTVVISSNQWTEVVPGTMIIKADTVLETSVYEPRTGERLIYRATMKAQFDLGPNQPIEMGAAVFAKEMARHLRKDGVIH
ncbi:MAG: hypothetical protein O7B25_01565 [Gammaproteobacteria bacterium]|nr:hypothetical protein [Gammaproteobacteria bacterium]